MIDDLNAEVRGCMALSLPRAEGAAVLLRQNGVDVTIEAVGKRG